MSGSRFGRHPRVAGVFGIGVGLLLLSLVVFRLAGGVGGGLTTVAFLMGLFGMGLALVSGAWYIALFARDFLYP
ncbi:MAG: hypothetical protein R3324_06700 [Halobacteriales archaeon]|nr:hypothetical protein [Halobacteriales archaeon]